MIEGQYANSLIYKRHSIRRFTDEPVRPEQLGHILHAAMAAPSAHNTQAWEYVVIDERAKLDEIAEFHPYAKMMRTATCAILACVRRDVADANPFYPQDMGASVENLLLAAAECGLGACWCGVHPKRELEEKFASLCNLPDNVFPFAIIALGHPKDKETASAPSDRYEANRAHRNTW
jgi:nitroreductase